ncbi:MAG: chorismate synthase [Bacteroidales bacterium]|nr:chorismate synthase [Bacteroidales bacterium]
MAGNTIGKLLTLTSFGESRGDGAGGVLDGLPAGIPIDIAFINSQLQKRRPASRPGSTPREESDEVRWLSGIREGRSTGAPIAFWMAHTDVRHEARQEGVLRPSHASYTYWRKYGAFDYDGGGRASARETVVRVVGGSLAQLLLRQQSIHIHAFTRQIGPVALLQPTLEINIENIAKNSLFCPDEETNRRMEDYLRQLRAEGDSTGAAVSCLVQGLPCGLGEPVYDKLQADLAKALMSINAAKGFEYGSGFQSVAKRGSELNDLFTTGFRTKTNFSGGIQGGISNGETVYLTVAFKPIPSIGKDQESLNEKGEACILKGGGRNDCCVAPRVVPVVEAMTALVMADHWLRWDRSKK